MLIIFGSINLDLIFTVSHLPVPGETVLSHAMRIEPGGKGANQAVAAARDGASVVFAGAVGQDALVDGALALMRQSSIDLTRVLRVEAPTGCAAIFVDPAGRNMISVGSGANCAVHSAQVENELLGPDATLSLQMEVPSNETASLIRRARLRGTRIIMNFAPAIEIETDALRELDVLVVNEGEAAWLAAHLGAESSPGELRASLDIPTVICTMGERGVVAATAAETFTVPARPIIPLDTTGAGDCFTGVLTAALDRGQFLETALHRANTAAALCCQRLGTQGSMPWASEIDTELLPGPR